MTVAVTLSEWQTTAPGDNDLLRGRWLTDRAARETATRLFDLGALKIRELRDGLSITSSSFVGHVRIGDLSIVIQPKVGGSLLLGLLRYTYRLRDLHRIGLVDADRGGLMVDLLIAQLRQECLDLMARGLTRRYQRAYEPLASPRGRIDVTSIARSAGLVAAALPCVHHPRSSDVLLNRLLVSGARFASSLAQDPTLRVDTARLASSLARFAREVPLDPALLASARRDLDRLVAVYEPALRLIELLVGGSTVGHERGEDARVPGFMFDMNRFFQELVGRFLTENLDGCRVMAQVSLKRMLAYAPLQNPRGRRPPRLRPDFVVARPGSPNRLMDAKYRDLWETSLPSDMLYQLAVYALADASRREAVILYPTTSAVAVDAAIDVQDPLTGSANARVIVRPVNLQRLSDALRSDSDARNLALRLVE